MNEIHDLHVGVNPVDGKWCVYVMVGSCDTAVQAKELAEKVGPKLGELLGRRESRHE